MEKIIDAAHFQEEAPAESHLEIGIGIQLPKSDDWCLGMPFPGLSWHLWLLLKMSNVPFFTAMFSFLGPFIFLKNLNI